MAYIARRRRNVILGVQVVSGLRNLKNGEPLPWLEGIQQRIGLQRFPYCLDDDRAGKHIDCRGDIDQVPPGRNELDIDHAKSVGALYGKRTLYVIGGTLVG